MDNKEERIRKWKNLMKSYMADHKYLKDLGKTWIQREGSSDVDKRLREALIHTDNSLGAIKDYFGPYMEISFVEYRGTIDTLCGEIATLKKEIEDLKAMDKVKESRIRELLKENLQLREEVEKCMSENLEALAECITIQNKNVEQNNDTLKMEDGVCKEDLVKIDSGFPLADFGYPKLPQ